MLKKHFTLVLALLVPLVTAVIIALSVYIPKTLSGTPEISLLFAYNRYESGVIYRMQNGVLIAELTPDPTYKAPSDTTTSSKSQLFLYSLKDEVVKEISFDEAKALGCKTLESLPNGMEVRQGSGSFSFIFYDRVYENSWYLTAGNVAYRLKLPQESSQFYSAYPEFLGWK